MPPGSRATRDAGTFGEGAAPAESGRSLPPRAASTGPPGPPFADLARRGSDWLRRDAWPVWLTAGVDWDRRAFHEHLDPATLRCSADFRRLRVAARQTAVFAEAARLGVEKAGEAVELGIAFLRGRARQGDGGYAWTFDLDNAPVDQTRDLYDHAFVLLALASAVPVLGREALRREALSLVRYLDARFAHPLGGYHEAIPRALPRRQNPHMHLLEAFLAAFELFGDAIFLDRADAVVRLFVERLFQPAEDALAEFFDDAWEPAREGGRFLVEPGHHAEWIWLLGRYGDVAGRAGRTPASLDLDAIRAALHAFVDRFGTAAGGGTLVDGVWSDGALQSATARLWPQCERLKAELPRCSAAGLALALDGVFGFFDGVPPGLWRERRAADGRFIVQPAPASSLYHLTGAFLDVHRRAAAR